MNTNVQSWSNKGDANKQGWDILGRDIITRRFSRPDFHKGSTKKSLVFFTMSQIDWPWSMCHMTKREPYKSINTLKWMDIDLNRTESGLDWLLLLCLSSGKLWFNSSFSSHSLPLSSPSFTFPSSSFCTSLTDYEILIWGTYMGQFLQDGKNDQTLSKKNIFCRFTVTKRFDFFNFSQLFWRDFVRWILKIVLFWS